MYSVLKNVSKRERELLIEKGYDNRTIDIVSSLSDKVRKGNSINLSDAMYVVSFQSDLKGIRSSLKKWWEFWK